MHILKVAAVALYPDGSSESIWCTSRGDFDRLWRPITLPKGARLFPFDGHKFMILPTYAQAEEKNLGILRN